MANPADFIMSLLHHESAANRTNYPLYFRCYEDCIQPLVRADLGTPSSSEIKSKQESVNICTKIGALLKRDFLNIMRNPMLLWSRFLGAVIMGIFMGGVFFAVTDIFYDTSNSLDRRVSGFRSVIGAMYNMTIHLLMSALSPVALTFPLEREVFLK